MTLLDNHLDQISLSARSIADLQFPPPKIFTNALLGNHEITTLIRDTEPHERALFSIDPNATQGLVMGPPISHRVLDGSATYRQRIGQGMQHRQSSAVAKVLGNDMLKQIQQSSRSHGKKGVDVEILLQGAERLCAVYAVAGADERIQALRQRYQVVSTSVAEYERKVTKQQNRLNSLNNDSSHVGQFDEEDVGNVSLADPSPSIMTEQDLRSEEDDIRELESRKRALEERIAGMERDLGGLLR